MKLLSSETIHWRAHFPFVVRTVGLLMIAMRAPTDVLSTW
jgi:hypothetical protein